MSELLKRGGYVQKTGLVQTVSEKDSFSLEHCRYILGSAIDVHIEAA